MNEPKPFNDQWVLELVGWIVGGIMAGLGSAMAWFRSSNAKRDQLIAELDERMTNYEAIRSNQATQIAVIQTCQANINEKMDDIKQEIQDSALRGAHSVNTQMAQVLNEVQKLAAHSQRRT